MGLIQKLPEATESSLEIQKYKIPCRAWGDAVIHSKFTSSNKCFKRAVLFTTATVQMTIKEKIGKALNCILR